VIQAAMAVRFGLPVDAALEGITIKAARQLMIDDRVGSLEVGKDADVVLHSGHPIDPRTRILAVWVNGKLVGEDGEAVIDDAAPDAIPHEHDHGCGEDGR
jgi:imidazolonepropionase-like amidohydrolase